MEFPLYNYRSYRSNFGYTRRPSAEQTARLEILKGVVHMNEVTVTLKPFTSATEAKSFGATLMGLSKNGIFLRSSDIADIAKLGSRCTLYGARTQFSFLVGELAFDIRSRVEALAYNDNIATITISG